MLTGILLIVLGVVLLIALVAFGMTDWASGGLRDYLMAFGFVLIIALTLLGGIGSIIWGIALLISYAHGPAEAGK